MTYCYYSTLMIALPVFITICIFLDAYNVHQGSHAVMKVLNFKIGFPTEFCQNVH